MPDRLKKSEPRALKEDQLPDFDSNALSSLTKKIEGNLKKQPGGKVSKVAAAHPKKRRDKKTLNSGSNLNEEKSTKITDNHDDQDSHDRKLTPAPAISQGKKRSRDGRVKDLGHQKQDADINGKKPGTKVLVPVVAGDLGMDEDVRALGGTQDDLNLIANAVSDSEMEGDDLPGEDINKELQQLIRQLGVDTAGRKEQFNDAALDPEDETTEQEEEAKSERREVTQPPNGVNPNSSTVKAKGKARVSMAVQPQSEWYTIELAALPASLQETGALPSSLVERLHDHAKLLLEHENKQYAARETSASSAHQFYSTIMSTGTLSDKISALTLSVQESPLHNMKALENLIGLARKRSRGQAVDVLGALKDLLGPGNLLPSDRKLRSFAVQPALSSVFHPADFKWASKDPLPNNLQEHHLILWAYEDWLKTYYFQVLQIIESWCNDEVVFARGKAVDYIYQLLKEKPEQEANLLRLLVNKLGDPDKKIASKSSFQILQLETSHPLMKPTIIAAIESDLLFRSGQSLHAKYYATITLNQTILSGKEENVARKLLDIYFSLFVKLLEKPKAAIPAASDISINKKGEVQGGGGVRGKKALKKNAEKGKATTVDEELREKMLSAVLTGVNRAIPFASTNDESFEKHVDTLFKVTHSSNFNTSIQALMLIQQLQGSHQGSIDRFYRTLYESLLDPRLLTSSKQALYLNLLFRALRSDLNVKRVKAFAKRLLQVVYMHQPSFTCGTLYLLRELEGIFAPLETFVDETEEQSDDEENFKDIQEVETDQPTPRDEAHKVNALPFTKARTSTKYDGRRRNPEHSNADHSSLWELTYFLHHYHPSVSLFATRLMTHDPMPPKPDLSRNTLIHFLDRFVYRNSKAASASKGASIMQPMVGGDSSSLLVSNYSNKDRSRLPVNTEGFWKQDMQKVSADEVFFHKYFSTLGRGKEKAMKKKEATKRKDEEGSESEGDEDEIWKALVDSRPELDEGSDGGIFSDDDMGSAIEDLDDADGSLQLEEGEEDGPEDEIDSDGSLGLEDNDDGALFDSDEEVPSDVDTGLKLDVHTNGTTKSATSDGPGEGKKRSKKRRRLKNLPTFASADDYAKMLDQDD